MKVYNVECDCGWALTTPHRGAFCGSLRRHVCGDGAPCRHCGRRRRSYDNSRGLCGRCFVSLGPDGRLDYERQTWSRDDLMAEWDELRRQGFTVRQAADRLGVTFDALDQALCRAKRDGDPRAIRSGVRLDEAS